MVKQTSQLTRIAICTRGIDRAYSARSTRAGGVVGVIAAGGMTGTSSVCELIEEFNLIEDQKSKVKPAKNPRRSPYCEAATPIPVPLRIA